MLDSILSEKQDLCKKYGAAKEDYKTVLAKKKSLQKILLNLIDQYDEMIREMTRLRAVLATESKLQNLFQSQ